MNESGQSSLFEPACNRKMDKSSSVDSLSGTNFLIDVNTLSTNSIFISAFLTTGKDLASSSAPDSDDIVATFPARSISLTIKSEYLYER